MHLTILENRSLLAGLNTPEMLFMSTVGGFTIGSAWVGISYAAEGIDCSQSCSCNNEAIITGGISAAICMSLTGIYLYKFHKT